MTYADKVTAVKEKYAERILKVLEGIRAAIQETGIEVSEPFDNHCDDYRWAMLAYVESKPDEQREGLAEGDIDIEFQIAESEQYDGEETGINFSVSVTTVGGRILGGMSPYNYSPDVWVDLDNADAVEARFALFEAIDPADILELFDKQVS